ncbi:hypothetical protein ACLMNJ_00195 [Streptomyces seoulensis]
MTDRPYEVPPHEGPYGAPYEGYDPYDPYAQQYPQGQRHPQQHQHPQGQPQPQAWPGQQQPYGDAHADAHADPPYTQEWQGQTWETQTHSRIDATAQPAAPTAYMTPLGHQDQPAPAPAHHAQQQPSAAEAYAAQQQQPSAAEPYAAQQQQPSAAPAQEPAYGRQTPAPAHPPVTAPEAAANGAGPGYGPATLGGNARVTDAQRARAEGRSPVIEPGMQPAALTALLGLLLAGAAQAGTYALLVPLVLLQAVTAAGWFRLNGMWPARQGIALGFAGALVCDAAVLATGRAHAPAAILGTLGVWVLLSLVLQLRSHADPDERMYGLTATVAAAALAIVATGYLAGGADAVTVGAASVAVAVLARALPLPTAASVVVALLAAAGAGVAVGGATGLGTKGAVLGAGAAVCALIGHRAASYDYPSRFVHFTAGVALPLTAAAPAVWVLGRALG